MTDKQKREKQAIENIQMLLIQKRLLEGKELCETSLREFVKVAWPVVEPGVPYVHGWHVDAICDHLEALAARKIRKLIINISRRSAKSTIVSVMFPAWRWIRNAEERFLTASYGYKLSIRDSRKCRNLIKSDWYQKKWGMNFSISKDQNEKGLFENNKGGYRLATSADGGNLGHGGSCMILDDCNDLDTIENKTIRQGTIDWYDGVMASCFVDPNTDVRLNIQQRGHQEDLTAHLLEFGDWELLTIPMEYEGSTKLTSIGWSDPRTHVGELMQPERFGEKEIEGLKITLGPHRYAGQCQQRPSAAAGGQLKREYWNYWNPTGTDTGKVKIKVGPELIEKAPVSLPLAFEQVVQSWDCTFKAMDHNDFVAGQAWGRVGANIYLIGRKHGHFDFPKTVQAIREMSAEFPCPEKLVEDKANGPAVLQTLKNEISGLIAVDPRGNKFSRVSAMSGYAEAGNIYLPNPDLFPWVKDLINEFADFPASKHDDDTDAMSQAALRLFDSVSNSGVPEFRVMPRVGEPSTACHIQEDHEMIAALPPNWRRWIAVSPGEIGAAIWICETPQGALRAYREMELEGMDAFEVGRRIAEATLPDVRAFMRSIHNTAKWQIDVLLEKVAFVPIEPIGSYAELLEQGILGYDPTSGTWESRQQAKQDLKQAKFSAQIGTMEDAAFDRLRDLLRFKPADYEELPYDRDKAFKLADVDVKAYNAYMDSVAGKIPGEYPRLKIAASCKHTIAAMGSNRRDTEIVDPFMRALLIALTAPPQPVGVKVPREVPGHTLRSRGAFNKVFRRAI